MLLSSVFKVVSNIMSGYENQMNFFYGEVAKMDVKTQISVLSGMNRRI